MTGWPISLGALFRGIALDNLPRGEAEALLRPGRRRLTSDARSDLPFARGHPLSLRLAASAMAERPG